ncbi:MAG: 2-oxoacid:ferredoxin oxidoreductase subunit gamma, partial [Elusimicrobia bacterium CG_4_10_14_0_2_um_filter_56_8]
AEVGNPKAMNMVALGAFAAVTGAMSVDAIAKAMTRVYKKLKPEIIELNVKALKRGAEFKLN